jgi:hypothetical protein
LFFEENGDGIVQLFLFKSAVRARTYLRDRSRAVEHYSRNRRKYFTTFTRFILRIASHGSKLRVARFMNLSRLMSVIRVLLSGCLVIVSPMGCSKARTPVQPRQAEASPDSLTQPANTKIDVCSLLTSAEIESVQGEPVKETKSSSNPGRGFLMSQCYFALPTTTNSVSLVVAQRGEGTEARDPKEFWRETFHRAEGSEEARERDKGKGREEEEEKKSPPQKIEGLGDEAFWEGSHISTALYVLKGDCFIRISVGGAVGDTSTKLEKSKKLANFALKRL